MEKYIKLFFILCLFNFFSFNKVNSESNIISNLIDEESLTSANKIDQLVNIKIIPKAPQTSLFEVYGNVLNTETTGSPSINIPIFNLVVDGVSVPISISYDATGLRVSDISSEVGLKWSLNVGGGISRTIKGLADEDTYGWFNVNDPNFRSQNNIEFPNFSWNENLECLRSQIEQIENNYIDVLPDSYTYKIPGYQGSFFFDATKTLRKSMMDDLVINPTDFTCVDNLGVIYKFGEGSSVSTVEMNSFAHVTQEIQNLARSGDGINEWKLTSITTKNNEKIIFEYIDYNLNYKQITGAVCNISQVPNNKTSITNHSTNFNYNNKLISAINSRAIRVEFDYETEYQAEIWDKKMTGITVISKLDGSSKHFKFDYDTYGGCSKLRLRSLTEIGNTDSIDSDFKKWTFNYSDNILPEMNSYETDYYGYYNQSGATDYIPLNYNLINGNYELVNSKRVNNESISKGILNEIIYPTGGRTKFYYEANIDSIDNLFCFAPGVRLRKTEDFPENGICNIKEYEYSGLIGNYFNGNYSHFIERYENGPIMLYSTPKLDLNPKNGFGYKQIELKYFSNNLYIGKEISQYKFYNLGSSTFPKIDKKITLNSSNERKNVLNYQYTTKGGQSLNLGWSINKEILYIPYIFSCINGDSGDDNIRYISVNPDYKYDTHGYINLFKVTSTDYFNTDSICKVNMYSYNENNQLDGEFIANGKTLYSYYTKYIYPTVQTFPELYNKGMIGLPIGSVDYVLKDRYVEHIIKDSIVVIKIITDSVIVGKNKINYDERANPMAFYDFINKSDSNYLKINKTFKCDNSGKIYEITYKDGSKSVFVWSYLNQLPVFEIKNATYNEIQVVLNNYGFSNFKDIIPTQEQIVALGRQLRASLTNAMVTALNYRHLAGLSFMSDSRDVNTFYIYDSLERLKLVSNHNGFPVQSNFYNYK